MTPDQMLMAYLADMFKESGIIALALLYMWNQIKLNTKTLKELTDSFKEHLNNKTEVKA